MGSCFSRCWCSCCTFDIIRRYLLDSNAPNVRLYQFKSSTDSFENTSPHYNYYARKSSENSSTCNIITSTSDQREGITSFTDDVSFIEPSSLNHQRQLSHASHMLHSSIHSTTRNDKSSFTSSSSRLNINRHSSFTRGIRFWALTGSFKKCHFTNKRRRKCKQNECCHHNQHSSQCSSDHHSIPHHQNADAYHCASASSPHHQMCHCTCETSDSRSSSIVSLCDNLSPKCHSRNKLYPFKCMHGKKAPIQSTIFHDAQLDTVTPSQNAMPSAGTHNKSVTSAATAAAAFTASKSCDQDAPISIINVTPVSMAQCITHLSPHHRQQPWKNDEIDDKNRKSASALIKRKEIKVNNCENLSESSNSLHNSFVYYFNLLRKPFHSSTSENRGSLFFDQHTSQSTSPRVYNGNLSNSDCVFVCDDYPGDERTKYNDGASKTLEITGANKVRQGQKEEGEGVPVHCKLRVGDTLHKVTVASGEHVDGVGDTCNMLRHATTAGTYSHENAISGTSGEKYCTRKVKRTSSSPSSSSSLGTSTRGKCDHVFVDDAPIGGREHNDIDENVKLRRATHDNLSVNCSSSVAASSVSSRLSSRVLSFLRTNAQTNDKLTTLDDEKSSAHFVDRCICKKSNCTPSNSLCSRASSEITTYSPYDENTTSTFRSRLSSLLKVKNCTSDFKSNDEVNSISSKSRTNSTFRTNLLLPFTSKQSSSRRLIEESSFTKDTGAELEFENLIDDFYIPEPGDAILELHSPESLIDTFDTPDPYQKDSSRVENFSSSNFTKSFSQTTQGSSLSTDRKSNWVSFNENISLTKGHAVRGTSEPSNAKQDVTSNGHGARVKVQRFDKKYSHQADAIDSISFNEYVEDCMKFRLPCMDNVNGFDPPTSSTDSGEKNKHHLFNGDLSVACECEECKKVHSFENGTSTTDCTRNGSAKKLPTPTGESTNFQGKHSSKGKKCYRNSFPLMDPLFSQVLDETYALAVTSRKRCNEAVSKSVSSNGLYLNNTVPDDSLGKGSADTSNDGQIVAPKKSVKLEQHTTLVALPGTNIDTCDCNLLVTNCVHKSSVQVEINTATEEKSASDSPSKSSIKSYDDMTTNFTHAGGDVSSIASVDAIDLEWDDYDQTNGQLEEEDDGAQATAPVAT